MYVYPGISNYDLEIWSWCIHRYWVTTYKSARIGNTINELHCACRDVGDRAKMDRGLWITNCGLPVLLVTASFRYAECEHLDEFECRIGIGMWI